MKNFFVVANRSKEEALSLSVKIKDYLEKAGAVCVFDETVSGEVEYGYTNIERMPKDTECVIVLGGDGTLLQASNDLSESDVVFLGINSGTLGYLSAVEEKDAIYAIDRILNDDFEVEKRMMIEGAVSASGDSSTKEIALNEIVIKGEKNMQMVYVSVYVNNRLLQRYRGDGVIVATPTGSTGYNLSAGGPIINPTAQTMILTPICPHSMLNRSIVFSSEDTIRIDIENDKYQKEQNVVVLFDNSHKLQLKSNDSVSIRKSEKYSKIAKLSKESFLNTLKNKLEG